MEDAVGVLFFFLIFGGVIGIIIYRLHKGREEKKSREQERVERKRIEDCGDVVMFFANQLGYIAKQAVSRDELEGLIDNGVSAAELAAEICSRIDRAEGLVLGYQPFEDWFMNVKLTQQYRDRHVYVIGKSGSGKTNLLRNLIYQDLLEGNGIGVIAPEAEMIEEEILPYIPDHRIDDVIYFNPAGGAYPVCFNPVHLDEGEDIDLRVDENLTIFRRLFRETGPRMDEILRQALYALLEKEGATLLDVERLLERTDSTFRNEVIRSSKDENTVHFFRDIYPQYPKNAHLPITHRLGRLIRPRTIRNILCNPQSSLNFREAMDEGKILLFNLSDGILGEVNSQLLGQLIVSKFQTATMSRADLAKGERRPFYLYIDEFQTFTGVAATSYEKILSRARKYRLGLILAHQQTGQIPMELLKEIFGNVSTMISFNVSQRDASRLAKEFISEYNGEIINVPEEEFLSLKVGQAYCKIGRHSFFMQTYLADQYPDRERARLIIEESRKNYGVSAREAEMRPKDVETGVDADVGTDRETVITDTSAEIKQVGVERIKNAPKDTSSEETDMPVEDTLEDLDPAKVFE